MRHLYAVPDDYAVPHRGRRSRRARPDASGITPVGTVDLLTSGYALAGSSAGWSTSTAGQHEDHRLVLETAGQKPWRSSEHPTRCSRCDSEASPVPFAAGVDVSRGEVGKKRVEDGFLFYGNEVVKHRVSKSVVPWSGTWPGGAGKRLCRLLRASTSR